VKRTIQILALIFAIGATIQTLRAYTSKAGLISVNEEEDKIIRLIELRKEIDARGFDSSAVNASADFPEITNREELNKAIVKHALRYIQAIGAEDVLMKEVQQPESKRLDDREAPGV